MARASSTFRPRARRGERRRDQGPRSRTRWRPATGPTPTARSCRATSSRRFVCTYRRRGDLLAPISSRPSRRIRSSPSRRSRRRAATIAFTWTGDNGFAQTETATITVDMTAAACMRRGVAGAASGSRPAMAAPRSRTTAAPASTTWAPRRRRCSATTPPIPACCGCSTGEALWSRAGAGRRAVLRRLPRRGRDEHARRRGALSGLRRRRGSADRPRRAASTCAARARQKAPAFASESRELLALTAFVAHQSRGLPIAPPDDPRLAPARERGRALFSAAQGSSTCPARNATTTIAGGRLAGSPIPQAHPTGYPLYRLEWQGLGSLQRRLRNCLTGVRAEPYAYGAPEYRRPRAVPDVPRRRHDGRDAGRAALIVSAPCPECCGTKQARAPDDILAKS